MTFGYSLGSLRSPIAYHIVTQHLVAAHSFWSEGHLALSPLLRPLVMASSCKVHTLGLPHFNPQFLLAHCVPRLSVPLPKVWEFGGPLCWLRTSRGSVLSLHFDNILGSCCSSLGMIKLSSPRSWRDVLHASCHVRCLWHHQPLSFQALYISNSYAHTSKPAL